MLKYGLTNEEISRRLYISLATAKRHVSNAYQKIGINNQKQLLNILKLL
jgi:DNA-binding CsgD family transcriptional regulator